MAAIKPFIGSWHGRLSTKQLLIIKFLSSIGKRPVRRRHSRFRWAIALPSLICPPTEQVDVSPSEAWLLGILVAEGHLTPDGKVKVASQNPELLARVSATWRKVAAGYTSEYTAASSFPNAQPVTQLHLNGNCDYGRYLYPQIYTREGHKRIPQRILNADHAARLAFLEGFNAGDGLRTTPCTYEFQGFCTASPVLAAGLYWLVSTTLEQRITLGLEERGDRTYYKLNLNSPQTTQSGQHLCKPKDEVIKAHAIAHEGWVFDLATTSGTFHAGIGQGWIITPRGAVKHS